MAFFLFAPARLPRLARGLGVYHNPVD
jgi:hypothetical protein